MEKMALKQSRVWRDANEVLDSAASPYLSSIMPRFRLPRIWSILLNVNWRAQKSNGDFSLSGSEAKLTKIEPILARILWKIHLQKFFERHSTYDQLLPDNINQRMQALTSKDWEGIWRNLRWYVHLLFWTWNTPEVSQGISREDIVQEAILKLFSWKRRWNPEKVPNLFFFVRGVAESLFSHHYAKTKYEVYIEDAFKPKKQDRSDDPSMENEPVEVPDRFGFKPTSGGQVEDILSQLIYGFSNDPAEIPGRQGLPIFPGALKGVPETIEILRTSELKEKRRADVDAYLTLRNLIFKAAGKDEQLESLAKTVVWLQEGKPSSIAGILKSEVDVVYRLKEKLGRRLRKVLSPKLKPQAMQLPPKPELVLIIGCNTLRGTRFNGATQNYHDFFASIDFLDYEKLYRIGKTGEIKMRKNGKENNRKDFFEVFGYEVEIGTDQVHTARRGGKQGGQEIKIICKPDSTVNFNINIKNGKGVEEDGRE